LAGLADRKKIEEINLMQLKILGYWSQEKLLPNSELGVLIGQYLQRWWGGKSTLPRNSMLTPTTAYYQNFHKISSVINC
jgi:hypothetical protein